MIADDKTLEELTVCKIRAVRENGVWIVDTLTDNGGWWRDSNESFSKALADSLRGHR